MNLAELKNKMNHVPDHKMHNDKPMHGPIGKKGEMAHKMHAPSGKVILKKPRMLSESEQKERTKNWPKSPVSEMTSAAKYEHQKRTGRSYDD